MSFRLRRVRVDSSKCRSCGFCRTVSICYSQRGCVGCLTCYLACPYEARFVEAMESSKTVKVEVDGVGYRVPYLITVAEALKMVGYRFAEPGFEGVSLACGTGGCWSCAVLIDGRLERSCVTPVEDGMSISTDVGGLTPVRIVHGPEPHRVGGKATPWSEVDYASYVEAAIWVAGCNLRCPQCQNYHVTYDNSSPALTHQEAARALAACQRVYGTKGVAVSGGEPTLNRRWLIGFFMEVSRLVGEKVRRHLDSNGTLLTPDYVDELVEAGCNNMGIEPKAVSVETYMRITGLTDRRAAGKWLETSWSAVKYIRDRYSDDVYLGVGLVYNRTLISMDEIADAGLRIASIDPEIQVTVLDYFPSFRRMSLKRPTVSEMLRVKRTLEEQGLKCVIVQTRVGHIGPGDRRV